jgi:hypothetical protein
MVRRAILDRDELPAPEDQILPDDQPAADPLPQRSQPWRGAGGRWVIWTGRAIVWAVLLLIGYRGVVAIATGEGTGSTSPRPAAKATASSTTFPSTLAEAYALQFGTAYLNWSPATAATRALALSHFTASAATDPQLGWNGAGTQRLDSQQVAGISVTSAHTAMVTLLASVNSGHLIELGVPVYTAGGKISVSGLPELLPAPPKASPPAGSTAADQGTEATLTSQLPAFFQAYASGDRTTLARFAAPGSHIRSLDGAVTFGAIDAVYAPPGGATRSVTVTVTWRLPAAAGSRGTVSAATATLEMTYQLTVVRQGASWDVLTIGQPLASGPP